MRTSALGAVTLIKPPASPGVSDWLTGTLSRGRIYIPQSFTLPEIIKFVLSVLGLTWQNIRQKMVRVIGEPAVRAMEVGFDLVMTLVTQGPAAAWQQIMAGISNLQEMVIGQVMTFVRERIVQAAITRLVTSLNPAGAFIQAILATYNTIMFFVERLRQISQVAMSFIDSISAIANGVIAMAASRVETTMAGMLTLVISFLARFAGLGNVSEAVVNIINRVRAPIDRALDRVVDWIVATARRLGRFIAQAGVPQDPNERVRLAGQSAIAVARRLRGRVTRILLEPALGAIKVRYGLAEIQPYEQGGTWWVRSRINPVNNTNTGVTAAPTSAATPEDTSVEIALLSTKQPRPSIIPASSIPRLGTAGTSPSHFEVSTTQAIAQVTGLTVETGARFMVKERRDPSGNIIVVGREAPPGFTASPSGLLLPTEPRLFGSLSTDIARGGQRDLEEPQLEQRRGDLRLRGLQRRPDALLITPTQIEPLEFTLDSRLAVRGRDQTEGSLSHKLGQIIGTTDVILKNFSRETPVVYTIYVRGEVPAEKVSELDRLLKNFAREQGNKIDVTVRFVRR